MVSDMQEQTFVNTKAIMTAIVDEGIGIQEADIIRFEKLAHEKQLLSINIAESLQRKSKEMDSNLNRLNVMIQKQESPFKSALLEDKSRGEK